MKRNFMSEESESKLAWFILLTFFTGGAFPIMLIIIAVISALGGGIGGGWKNYHK